MLQRFVFNPFLENTYVLELGKNETVVIDPGCQTKKEKRELETYLQENNLKVCYSLNTHLHVDHIYGNEMLESNFQALSVASEKDKIPREYSEIPIRRKYFPFSDEDPKINLYAKEGDVFEVGTHKINVIETPGHSPGSLSYYVPTMKMVFVGDLLEKSGYGTLEYIYSNEQQMKESVKKILSLPLETLVYFGHGDCSSVESLKLLLGTDLEQ